MGSSEDVPLQPGNKKRERLIKLCSEQSTLKLAGPQVGDHQVLLALALLFFAMAIE